MTGSGGPTKLTLPPTALRSRVTEIENVYVIGHFGIARVAERDWSLRIGGAVTEPLELTMSGLRALPSVTVTAVLECFGNPLAPSIPVRRAANVVWRGVPVADLLMAAGVEPGATALWAEGMDSGRFDDVDCTEYLKDLPLEIAVERGIVAYEMNGAPLTAEHGFPARLFVPGYFGTNNVKWLRELTVTDRRPEHLFTTRLYQRLEPGSSEPRPVRDIDVTSLITIAPGSRAPGEVLIEGWAWGAAQIERLQLRIGGSWTDTELERRPTGTFGWQRFSHRHRFEAGDHEITARATDALGRVQPLADARNQVHSVTLSVR
ncbi:molybdopterin-dependent oxidoreductase [Pseudonocardia spinosispora]|uniref:molybdopterin-dependent oxidoreductase n=1 Tax=Pseudonocardia spinosispora TaxID=103441 RepID=UPI00041BEB5C|nr:molybdopterin-dependent oxidoreductase [Pseudonocardia spinosispora]